jgi:hypothetical protein
MVIALVLALGVMNIYPAARDQQLLSALITVSSWFLGLVVLVMWGRGDLKIHTVAVFLLLAMLNIVEWVVVWHALGMALLAPLYYGVFAIFLCTITPARMTIFWWAFKETREQR